MPKRKQPLGRVKPNDEIYFPDTSIVNKESYHAVHLF
jgi:hypothetical protein